jgi:hypothetical protein
MPKPPETRDAITAVLKELGPMTVPELVQHFGWTRTRVNACLTTARNNHPGKFFRIVRYQKQIGVQGRETPVYAASPGADAPRPKFDAEYKQQRRSGYYQRNRARFAVARKRRTGKTEVNPWAGLIPMQRRRPQPTPHTGPQ